MKKKLYEVIIADIIPELMTDTKQEIQEAQRTPSRLLKNKTKQNKTEGEDMEIYVYI